MLTKLSCVWHWGSSQVLGKLSPYADRAIKYSGSFSTLALETTHGYYCLQARYNIR